MNHSFWRTSLLHSATKEPTVRQKKGNENLKYIKKNMKIDSVAFIDSKPLPARLC